MRLDNKLRLPSPKGSAVYPWLTTPDTKFDDKGRYRVNLRVRADDPEFEEFKQAAQEVLDHWYDLVKAHPDFAKRKLEKVPLKVKPVIDPETDEAELTEDGVEQFDIVCDTPAVVHSAKLNKDFKTKIVLLDAKMHPLPAGVEIGRGSVLRLSLQPYGYIFQNKRVGITLRPRGVQVLDLRAPSSSPEAMGFKEEEGYSIEDFPADQGAESADF
jgi:hypothetical protein